MALPQYWPGASRNKRRLRWRPGTATDALIFTGAMDVAVTVVPGPRLQVAFGIALLHETVTAWLNHCAAVT